MLQPGQEELDTLLAAKGVELKPWRLHDLRRTAATHMVRLGVSELVVGRVLNHAPQGVTQAATIAIAVVLLLCPLLLIVQGGDKTSHGNAGGLLSVAA